MNDLFPETLPAENHYDVAASNLIQNLQEAIAALPFMPTDDLPVVQIGFENEHQFTPGVYARTMRIPAGTVNTSKIHKVQHTYVLRAGRISVVDSFGKSHIVVAGAMGITYPGTKRAVLGLEDAVLTTFHPNPDNCTDIDELERRYIAQTFDEYDDWERHRVLPE